MPDGPGRSSDQAAQIRLFLEEICTDVARFEHLEAGARADEVRVQREVVMGAPNAYADMRVEPKSGAPYYVEVVFGYGRERTLATLRRKYLTLPSEPRPATRLVLVASDADLPEATRSEARAAIAPSLELEVWTEGTLRALVSRHFQVELGAIDGRALRDVREAIDRAKWRYAFGDDADGHALAPTLLWHLDSWHLRRLRDAGRAPEAILEPGSYKDVVVLMADLCSFSSYVRDTRDDAVIRNILTGFYSKARGEVLEHGGLVYQFVGDEIVAIFGIPDNAPDDVERAFACACALVDVGYSVSNGWQRHLDRVQKSGGVHVGLAIGDLSLVSLRPFSRRHVSFIGDTLNLTARLLGTVGPGEIAVSNSLYRRLDESCAAGLGEMPPIEAKNMGEIRAWKRGSCTPGRKR